MFSELFRFELYYRRRRPTTYIYFLVIFLTSFITLINPTLAVANTADSTSANAPYTIAVLMVVLSFFFTLITSSLVGVAVIRDVEHEMAPIIFTTSIRKGSYLFGRFVGSLVVLILLNTGIIFGALIAFVIGPLLPSQWEVAWHAKEMLPFNLWAYLQPFLIFSVTNIFITGSFFFAAGALIRKPVVIYAQGIALLMLYQIANIFYLRDMDSQRIAAILDPFAVQTFTYMTRYWTPVEQNTLLIPFENVMLYNRLIWVSVAIIVLAVTYWRFSFTLRGGVTHRKKKIVESTEAAPPVAGTIPEVAKNKGMSAQFKQLSASVFFHFRDIWREVPFLAIAGTGLLVLLVNSVRMGAMLGTSSYATTGTVLTMLNSFSLFFTVIMIFYSGEIVWKERQFRIHSIIDSTSVPTHIVILSKYVALCLVYLSFLVAFFIYGILLQSIKGYYQYELPAYFGKLSETFISLCLTTLISIFIQIVTRNKFLGFVCSVMVLLLIAMFPGLGIEHEMFAYSSGSLGDFSQMNGFGHFVIPFVWLKTYWAALGIVFFVTAVGFYRRHESLSLSLKIIGGLGFVIFIGAGANIYYNTYIVNHFENSGRAKIIQVSNEKELKNYESATQPSIVEVNISIDLYPQQRSFESRGYYYLKNYDSLPVKEIRLQYPTSPDLNLHDISFGRTITVGEDRSELGYRSFNIDPPLAAGDSLRMDFAVDFTQKGFKSKSRNIDIVYNGSLLHSNDYLPKVGFRKEPDRIRFKAIVSTDDDQIALAPGRLVKEWRENDRKFYQYEVARSIPDFYAILSGKYEVKKEKWNDIDLEIYYHPSHPFNVDKMMQGLKDGLAYNTKSFGSNVQSPIRIIEFPRYGPVAQSFPGMIALSEVGGFILKISDESKDLDVPYFVTAHELSHQWWGQQVIEADAPGKLMLSEGLAQYSALMVMKHAFPPEVMQGFLKFELDAYLRGRTSEKQKELPLMSARNQQYISNNKSALAFFSLQDYIGEDSLNMALRRYYNKWTFKNAAHPVSKDLVDEIRKVTPDSLQYVVNDLFERITLYENKTTEAAYSDLKNNNYEVTFILSVHKFQVDANGIEKPLPMNDWIDVGIYGEDEKGKSKLIYLKKHKFTKEKNTLVISVTEKPVKVGIDPLHKLIDHQPTDNVISVGTVVDIAN